MNQSEMLEKARKAIGATSDHELAEALGMRPSNISRVRSGKQNLGPESALKLAEILKIDPAKVAAAAYAARATSSTARRAWERAAALCVMLALGATFGGNVKAQDLQTKHYARKGRKRRMGRKFRRPITCIDKTTTRVCA